MTEFELVVKGKTLLISIKDKCIYDATNKKLIREMSEDDYDYFKQIAQYHQ